MTQCACFWVDRNLSASPCLVLPQSSLDLMVIQISARVISKECFLSQSTFPLQGTCSIRISSFIIISTVRNYPLNRNFNSFNNHKMNYFQREDYFTPGHVPENLFLTIQKKMCTQKCFLENHNMQWLIVRLEITNR